MYHFDRRITYSEVGPDRKMDIAHIVDFFQDCSTFQSESLDVGLDYLSKYQCGWVLVSWQVEVKRYPQLGEYIQTGTWPYAFDALLGHRNFVLKDETGEWIARANSIWSLVDLKTGHPIRITEKYSSAYVLENKLDMNYLPRKIPVPKSGGQSYPAIQTARAFLDTNNHVNNAKYIVMALEYLPLDTKITRLRVEYKHPAFYKDKIYPVLYNIEDKIVVSLNSEQGTPYVIVEFSNEEIEC